jgi:hypothetical protein
MKQVGQIAERAVQSAESDFNRKPSDESRNPGLPKLWADALMAKFFSIWPGKWSDAVALAGGLEVVSEEWRVGLAGMSGEDIKRALEVCRTTMTWPPSIAEFRAAASDGSTPEQKAFQRRARESDEAQAALPAETWAETRERGKAHLAALRGALSGVANNDPSQYDA